MPDSSITAAPNPAESPPGLDKKLLLTLAGGQFGSAIQTVSLVLVSFPLAAAAVTPDSKIWTLGLLTGLHALVLIVVAPLAGVLSDRCTSRFGMRRPFILAGSLLAGAAMFVMGYSDTLPGLLVGDVLHAAGTGIFSGGFAAVVPDRVPEAFRGRVVGVMSAMSILAGVTAAVTLPALMDHHFALFALPGVLGTACSVAVAIALQDRLLSADRAAGPAMFGLLVQFQIKPRQVPDFSWAWTSKFFLTLGSAFTTTYGVYFLTDQLEVSDTDLPALISATGLVGLVTAVVGAGVGAYISDRFQVRKIVILLSAFATGAGAVIIATAPDIAMYFTGMVVTGLATGMLMPVEGALMVDVLPGEGHESGKFMALAGLSDSLPRSIGPVLAPGVIALGALTPIGGYPAVYLTGGALAVIGGLLIRTTKGSY